MILICGIPSEAPTRMVIQAAAELGLPHLVLNQRELYNDRLWFNLDYPIAPPMLSGELYLEGKIYNLNDIQGVFNRMMDIQSLPTLPQQSAQEKSERIDTGDAINMLHHAIQDWLEITPARVMNRGSAMTSNFSKPYQAQLIKSSGFRVPETLITNVPEEVMQFISKHRRVIYKSISAERSVVREIEPSGIQSLDKIRNLPTQFQVFIPGVDYRVHVIGKKLYACQIRTDAVDYRYANLQNMEVQIQPVKLQKSIEGKCLELSSTMNLPLCGIDLKRTPEGIWYCFEVNPMPAFSYYEEQTGQPIARTIVEYLGHVS